MSDSNRVRLSFAQEATYGIQPNATLTDLRITGESLKQATNTVSSQELRSDRNIPDLLRVNANVDGDVNFELSYQSSTINYDLWWLYALGSTGYSSNQNISGFSGTFASAGAATYQGTLQRTDGGSFSVLSVGRWVRISLATNVEANEGWWKITAMSTTSVANDTITIVGYKDVTAGASAASGLRLRQHGTALNGTSPFSMTLVKQYVDLTNEYEIYTGCMIDRVSLSITNDQIITGSWSLIGKNAVSATSNYPAGAPVSYLATGTNPVATGVSNVIAVMENNDPFTATGFTFQLQNNLRARQVIASFGTQSVGMGSVAVTGTLTAYFSSKTVVDKYLNATPTTLSVIVADAAAVTAGATNGYQIWDFQQVKFTSGQVVAAGLNGDVMVELAWQALLESGETADGNHTIRYTRGESTS